MGKITNKILINYLENLDKLLEQQVDWFIKRVEYIKESNWQKATEIENIYLKPLERKIVSLAKIIREELK